MTLYAKEHVKEDQEAEHDKRPHVQLEGQVDVRCLLHGIPLE